MKPKPVAAGADGESRDEAFQRMLAARAEVHRLFFSVEAMANEFPEDAPEVIGIHSPDVMRAEFKDAPRAEDDER